MSAMVPLILDQHGRPLANSSTGGNGFSTGQGVGTGWEAGGYDTHRTSNWLVTSASANALVASGENIALRDRARDAIRNNPLAVAAINAFVSNAIGTGIKPLPEVDNEDFRQEISEAWQEFVEDCDADGVSDFYGLQALACRAMREAGDCFFRFRHRTLEEAGEDGLSVPLQLQIIEADFLDNAKNENRGRSGIIRAGIEFSLRGRRRAYHFWKQHPNDLYLNLVTRPRVRVPAKEVIHVYEVKRPGQVRGVTFMAPILTKLLELQKYDDAELLRKQLAAMFVAFEQTPSLESQDPIGGGSLGYGVMNLPLASLEPGTYQRVPPGHEVKFSDPADVTGQYEMFMTVQQRMLATACSITYEMLTGDYKQVTFSSVRAALIEFRREMKQFQQNVIVHQMCRPIYRRWFETALLSGRLSLPAGLTPRQAMKTRWIPMGFEHVDPDKEMRAIEKALAMNITSRSAVIAEQGDDAMTVDREIAEDQERIRELGIISEAERVAIINASDSDGGDDGNPDRPSRAGTDDEDDEDDE